MSEAAETVAPTRRFRSAEELAMREIVAADLRRRWPEARIIHELPLRYSSNSLDMAAVTQTEINAVEIKSSRDLMDRLEQQLRNFAPIVTRLIVALAPKWNEKLPSLKRPYRQGIAYVPQLTEAQQLIAGVRETHIETWTVCATAGTIERTEGGYAVNVHPWSFRLLHILHVAELTEVALAHHVPGCHGRPHDVIARACASGMTGDQVKRAVCQALRARDRFAAGSDAPIIPGGQP